MLTLYDNAGSTNALKLRILLEELGLEYASVEVSLDGPKPGGYERLHPFGLVPTLVDDDVVVTEAGRVAALERTLASYDRLLDPRGPWATGSDFTVADCALGGRALHLGSLPLASECAPRLRRVLAALAQRASFARALRATHPGPAP